MNTKHGVSFSEWLKERLPALITSILVGIAEFLIINSFSAGPISSGAQPAAVNVLSIIPAFLFLFLGPFIFIIPIFIIAKLSLKSGKSALLKHFGLFVALAYFFHILVIFSSIRVYS